jgi:hypothetical protein
MYLLSLLRYQRYQSGVSNSCVRSKLLADMQ